MNHYGLFRCNKPASRPTGVRAISSLLLFEEEPILFSPSLIIECENLNLTSAPDFLLHLFICNISKTQVCIFTTFPNNKRWRGAGCFWMNFEMFGNVVSYCLEYLIRLLNRNYNKKRKGGMKS